MNLQDGKALFVFRQWHDDGAVEATWAQQRGVEYIGAVGGRHDDDAFTCFKSVHFGEHLVECLFALVVTTTESGAALAANGVDFVDENNGTAHFASLLEEVAYATCAHANEHFHKV